VPRVLLTAFEPYGSFQANSSWLTLMELTRDIPEIHELTTRLYPVDFAEAAKKLREDVTGNYDLALHLGQSPGSAQVALEAFAINAGNEQGGVCSPLTPSGPAAFATDLPLEEWAAGIRQAGVPAHVSHHAGTYLCNAVYYWSCFYARQLELPTRSLFVHLPLDTSQVVDSREPVASLAANQGAVALRHILNEFGA
jgi:pyroglutamyl-peptidase